MFKILRVLIVLGDIGSILHADRLNLNLLYGVYSSYLTTLAGTKHTEIGTLNY